MTIAEMLDVFCFPDDQLFSVYDWSTDKNLFRGYLNDCPDEILDLSFDTIDNIYNANDIQNGIVFNVDSENEF